MFRDGKRQVSAACARTQQQEEPLQEHNGSIITSWGGDRDWFPLHQQAGEMVRFLDAGEEGEGSSGAPSRGFFSYARDNSARSNENDKLESGGGR